MKTIQLPDEVYERVEQIASTDHVSVDMLVTALVNEGVSGWSELQVRAARGSLERLNRVLSKVRDTPPAPADQI
jgi:predicted DNA-binding ribbon-helix-helix protein